MMKTLDAKLRLALAVVILFMLMTGPFVLAAGVIWLDAQEAERVLLQQLIVPRLPLGTLMTAIGFVLGVGLIVQLFRGYIGGLQRMAEHLRLLMDANRHFKIRSDGPPEVRSLAEAANALAVQRNELVDSVEKQIQAAHAQLEAEKNRLAAVVSDLSQAVVVCNLDGRVLLYNQQAKLVFSAMGSGAANLGLGRSIHGVLERKLIEHALEIVAQQIRNNSRLRHASFVAGTPCGQMLRVQLAPVLGGEAAEPVFNGYILAVENITQQFEHEQQRDQAFKDLISEINSGLIPARNALQNLNEVFSQRADERAEDWQQLSESILSVQRSIEAGMLDFARMLKFRWPLDEMLAADIVVNAQQRIESKLGLSTHFDAAETNLWIRADSYHLVFALEFLAAQLEIACDLRSVTFRLGAHENDVWIDLSWQGPVVSMETVAVWELDAMVVGDESSPLSLREVLQRHHGQMHYERNKVRHEGYFRLCLPKVTPAASLLNQSGGRPEYYDFDLFHAREMGDLLDRPLRDLVYTVFDTETTGLEPSKGDEIIQIGAVRIVNNKLLTQENLDVLIDPRFPLPPAGIPIHGITDAMVRGQPTIDKVLPVFHAFASDTILVAHNAAFDMRFLQLKEDQTGVRFGQPVLDTLLLSAVVSPNQESHALDAIAERLGVEITQRHNALGDAWVTASVFLRLLPLLADQGIVTLRQALEAAEKTYFARIKY